ncbi:IS110 family transposase [Streptosporangium sp. NBC_01755]|uniref:IS110 family transposase n=1 Tax=unclassified Streptosporangium TaxID=2632669 RepID=UPI002DDB0B83|nr:MULTISPECIES: transposase [unclassified Streptosporangium]WSA25639.1 IS110 family transposase [Streptosporangium sp. NBC_01810]WSD02971.1 IS110 family transposase [Streptosporangium sp. NBC_01755]
MLEEARDHEEIIERVAALDIGKAFLVCCARVPDEDRPGRRLQEVQTYATMTGALLQMADHLHALGVTRVVMEATSDYWKPIFYLLEAAGFETWLVNARDVKSSTCPVVPRPTGWMRSGWPRSPNGRCYAPASSPRRRSAGFGT